MGSERGSLRTRLPTSRTAQRNLRSPTAQHQTSEPAAAKRHKACVGTRGRDVVGDAEGPARQGFSAVTEAACSFTMQLFLLNPFPAGPVVTSQNKQLPCAPQCSQCTQFQFCPLGNSALKLLPAARGQLHPAHLPANPAGSHLPHLSYR